MPDMGLTSIIGLVSALASAASTVYGMTQGGGKGGPGGMPSINIPAPLLPQTPKASPADLAAIGAMKPELMGAVTPSWKSGLSGGTTGPLFGTGSILAAPIGGPARPGVTGAADLSNLMGDTANVFGSLG